MNSQIWRQYENLSDSKFHRFRFEIPPVYFVFDHDICICLAAVIFDNKNGIGALSYATTVRRIRGPSRPIMQEL